MYKLEEIKKYLTNLSKDVPSKFTEHLFDCIKLEKICLVKAGEDKVIITNKDGKELKIQSENNEVKFTYGHKHYFVYQNQNIKTEGSKGFYCIRKTDIDEIEELTGVKLPKSAASLFEFCARKVPGNALFPPTIQKDIDKIKGNSSLLSDSDTDEEEWEFVDEINDKSDTYFKP